MPPSEFLVDLIPLAAVDQIAHRIDTAASTRSRITIQPPQVLLLSHGKNLFTGCSLGMCFAARGGKS
jgi:hypothetical protein